MKTATLRNAQDAYVDQAKPDKNYRNTAQMYLQDGTFGYVFFTNPVPARARIVSAKLRFWNGNAFGGNITMAVSRVAEKWSVNRVNWKNRPGVTGAAKTVTKSNAAAGTMWEFDVSAMLQQVSDGAKWFGFRVDVNGSSRKWIHSTQSNRTGFRPYLEVTWSEDPFAPTELNPNDDGIVSVAKPVLRWDFFDVAGNKEMAAYQVQISATNNFGGALLLDTGEVPSSEPILYTDTTSWGGLADGARAYWRVRVKDGAGLWSTYSEAESFRRLPKPVVTITSPGVNNLFEESTPPISWTFSAPQTQYQVLVDDAETQKNLWDTGVVTATDNAVEVPAGKITEPGKLYRVTVRLWDDQPRETTVGDPAYSELVKEALYQPSSAVTPTSNLTVVQNTNGPGVTLEWDSATQPDGFTIYRDGKVLLTLENAEDYLIGGSTTRYRYIDRKVPGRRPHTWSVARVVNGAESADNEVEELTVRNTAPFLMRKNGADAIALANPDIDPGLTEESDVLYPQDGPPMLVTSSLYGFVGTASGILAGEFIPGMTAEEQLDRFLRMREDLGATFYFLWADQAIECAIFNCKVKMIPVSDGTTDYQVSFGFIQVDY